MAGDDKTEQPTPKRLRDAAKKGDVARSPAPSAVAAAACAAVIIIARWPSFLALFKGSLQSAFGSSRGALLSDAAASIAPHADLLLLLAVAPMLAACAAGLAQAGLVFAPARLEIDMARFSPGAALERIFGSGAAGHAALALAGNLVLSAAALYLIVHAVVASAALYRSRAPVLPAVAGLFSAVVWQVLVVAAVYAVADWALKRRQHRKRLMMTKQEVKEEYRETEGDPHVKAQRRRLHRQLALASLKKGVRTARVLLVNPTRLAVALRYGDTDDAPIVAYKGGGEIAARMRAEAEDAGVPIVKDVPLARAIFAQVEIDEEIPPALYEAVAAIFNAAARAAADVTTVEFDPG